MLQSLGAPLEARPLISQSLARGVAENVVTASASPLRLRHHPSPRGPRALPMPRATA